MAEVYHKYVRAGEKVPQPTKKQIERDESNAKFAAARARKETALATLRENEARKRDGELIEKKTALRQASFILATIRARFLALPAPLSRKLEGKTQHERKLIIDAEIRAILEELSTFPANVTQGERDAFNEENGEERPQKDSPARSRRVKTA